MSHYKPYPAYKDSGVEWLGEVPEHWENARLRWLSTRYSGGTPDRLNLDYWTEGNIPWINSGAVNQLLISEPSAYITEAAYKNSSAKWIPAEALVIALAGQGRTKGMVAQLAIPTTCNQSMAAIIPNQELVARFLFWWLTSNYQNIRNMAGGDLRDGLNLELLGDVACPVAPFSEQQTIAAFLDRETARIDALIAKKTRFIELLQEKRSALITHAVTKGLDPNMKMKDSGVEWIGQVPEHWGVKRLRHVASFKNSNVDKKAYDDQEAVNLCNYTDVYYNEFITPDLSFMQATASAAEIEQFSLKKGDVLITKDSEDPSDIGIPSFVAEEMPGVVCGYHLTMIRGDDFDTARLLHRILQSHPTQAHFFVEAPGITRYGLSQDAIGDLCCCLPPKMERCQIADHLDRETTRIDALIAKTQRSIDLLKERRSTFITAAVTGQIDLRGEIA